MRGSTVEMRSVKVTSSGEGLRVWACVCACADLVGYRTSLS